MPGKRVSSQVPYPSKAIGDFLGEVGTLLQTQVYNKFKHVIIGSFNKAVLYLEQLNNDPNVTSEHGMYKDLPMMIYTPTLEEPVPQTDFLWNYPNTHPYMAHWNRPPIIFEDGTMLTMTTRRMQGNIDLRIFVDSQPEEHDIQMSFLNFFRGLNTVVPLNNITLEFCLSDKIKMLTDRNDEIVLNLLDSNISHKLVKATNQYEYMIPIGTTPLLRLSSLTDASTFYGGTDFAEFALSGSLQYELEIPSILTLQTELDIRHIEFNIRSTVDTDTGTIVEPVSTIVQNKEETE